MDINDYLENARIKAAALKADREREEEEQRKARMEHITWLWMEVIEAAHKLVPDVLKPLVWVPSEYINLIGEPGEVSYVYVKINDSYDIMVIKMINEGYGFKPDKNPVIVHTQPRPNLNDSSEEVISFNGSRSYSLDEIDLAFAHAWEVYGQIESIKGSLDEIQKRDMEIRNGNTTLREQMMRRLESALINAQSPDPYVQHSGNIEVISLVVESLITIAHNGFDE